MCCKNASKRVLPPKAAGVTNQLPLVGTPTEAVQPPHQRRALACTPMAQMPPQVAGLPGAATDLGGGLTEAMVRFAARFEYARTVEDVLARRSRLLFLDARLAIDVAPAVAAILQEELGGDPQLPLFWRWRNNICPEM